MKTLSDPKLWQRSLTRRPFVPPRTQTEPLVQEFISNFFSACRENTLAIVHLWTHCWNDSAAGEDIIKWFGRRWNGKSRKAWTSPHGSFPDIIPMSSHHSLLGLAIIHGPYQQVANVCSLSGLTSLPRAPKHQLDYYIEYPWIYFMAYLSCNHSEHKRALLGLKRLPSILTDDMLCCRPCRSWEISLTCSFLTLHRTLSLMVG